ncbi:MAG: FCD domain-containing protein, partial [Myxococcota bacterium]
FESEAAALAAREIDSESLSRLEGLVGRMLSTDPGSKEDADDADREFHLTIAAASGNTAVRYIVETLWRMRTELQPVADVHAAICAREDARNRATEHADVFEALKNRDAGRAREAMQNHFRHLLESMINVTEEQAMHELRQRATQSRQRYLNSSQG